MLLTNQQLTNNMQPCELQNPDIESQKLSRWDEDIPTLYRSFVCPLQSSGMSGCTLYPKDGSLKSPPDANCSMMQRNLQRIGTKIVSLNEGRTGMLVFSNSAHFPKGSRPPRKEKLLAVN